MTKITWWKLFRWRLESHSEQRVITTTTAKTYAHSYNNKKSQNFFSRFRNLIFFLPLYSHLNFFPAGFFLFPGNSPWWWNTVSNTDITILYIYTHHTLFKLTAITAFHLSCFCIIFGLILFLIQKTYIIIYKITCRRI